MNFCQRAINVRFKKLTCRHLLEIHSFVRCRMFWMWWRKRFQCFVSDTYLCFLQQNTKSATHKHRIGLLRRPATSRSAASWPAHYPFVQTIPIFTQSCSMFRVAGAGVRAGPAGSPIFYHLNENGLINCIPNTPTMLTNASVFEYHRAPGLATDLSG